MRTTRFWRQAVWLCATTAFWAASLQVAAPLHAEASGIAVQGAQCPCPDAPDAPHDKDTCAVCQFLFGLSGNTLPPTPTPVACELVTHHRTTYYVTSLHLADLPQSIIPRAPPVA